MATTKKSKRLSKIDPKFSNAHKLPRTTRPAPQVPDANGPSSSNTALTKSITPRLERKLDPNSSGTEERGALATRDTISKLGQSYAAMLGVASYFVVAAGIVDPKTLQNDVGLNHDEVLAAAHDSVAEFVHKMRPRDPLEKITLEQLIVNHARVLRLSQQACGQTDPESAKLFHEACDGASGSFRRLTTAFNENRKPPRQKASIAIDQANVANQQVVQNVTPSQEENRRTNKDPKK